MFFNVYMALFWVVVGCMISAKGRPPPRYSTQRVIKVGRKALEVNIFHPESKFETLTSGLEEHPAPSEKSLQQTAIDAVASHLGIPTNQIHYNSGYATEIAQVAYVNQAHEGVPFSNAVANIAWKENKIVSIGSSFVSTDKIAPSVPSLPVEAVIPGVEDLLEGNYNNHPINIEYLVKQDGSVALTYVVQIQNDQTGAWFETFVDAHSGELLSVTDFVADARYKVLPIEKQALPQGQDIVKDPQDLFSSPFGWHGDGVLESNNTSGNNVIAYKGLLKNVTFQTQDSLVFDYTDDDTVQPYVGENVDAARTNAFYIINTVHDFAYRYGFTESAFNFQLNNWGKGGRGNDLVYMSVQDSSGLNNANFATPPDGQSGICRMYLWTYTRPIRRDGAMDNDIIVHEMTHGITNRMTGGGTGRCLQTIEARGMGEGWSDAMAEWTEQTSTEIEDFTLGRYVLNNTAGIRNYPYSTDPKVNALRYSSIAVLDEVHNIGEVWANILHNIYAALVGQHGFSATARTTPDGTEGNVIFLHLFIDALALQPCNPTFIAARDAWLQADDNRYNGMNFCLLWRVFASRGLGVLAAHYHDSDILPPACIRAD